MFVYFSHDFLSVIYKIINNTQDITFGEYNSVQFYKQYKSHKTADDYSHVCVYFCFSLLNMEFYVTKTRCELWYAHRFFLFNWIELNSCLFPFFSLVIVAVLISASYLLRLNLSLMFYTCWRLNYGSCLVHWTKVVIYWFVFIRFVRWLLMTSSKWEYSHSLIFWNELHKECYKLAIESYEFHSFRSNWTFFIYSVQTEFFSI